MQIRNVSSICATLKYISFGNWCNTEVTKTIVLAFHLVLIVAVFILIFIASGFPAGLQSHDRNLFPTML